MKNILSIFVVLLVATACTKEPESKPIDKIVCGITDVAASITASQIQKVQQCEFYPPLKDWAAKGLNKAYNCEGISIKGPICEMAIGILINNLAQEAEYSEAVTSANCKLPFPPKLDELKKQICSKIPL